jgi:hypothetical protein
METTIEIAEPLLDEARHIARRVGKTLRSLVVQGLRKVVAERRAQRKRFVGAMRVSMAKGCRASSGTLRGTRCAS